MEKLKSRLYLAVFCFTVVSFSLALINTGRQRDFYYIAIYLSIIGLFIERKNINFKSFNIAYPIILFGLIKVVWYLWYQYGTEAFNSYNDHLVGGKKLVLGGVLVFYLTQLNYHIKNVDYKKWLLIATGAAVLGASCYAWWQIMHGMQRAEMSINRATISAYIYSALSIFFIYQLYAQNKLACYVIAALAIILSFVVIITTGTRAAIICHLLIVFLMTAYHFKKIHLKTIFAVLIVAAIAFGALYNKFIYPKIAQTYNEITLYQEGKDNTSLGARFSMWTIGLKNFAHAPLGQSLQSRYDYSAQYVIEKPQYRSAMEFINVHLHDETIDTLSLQGILGGLALLWLYIGISWVALRNRNTALLFTLNCMIVYGLSDVILLSSEAILFFVALIGVCSITLPQQKQIA